MLELQLKDVVIDKGRLESSLAKVTEEMGILKSAHYDSLYKRDILETRMNEMVGADQLAHLMRLSVPFSINNTINVRLTTHKQLIVEAT